MLPCIMTIVHSTLANTSITVYLSKCGYTVKVVVIVKVVGAGRWAMGDGRWAMGDGRWAVGGGRHNCD